MRKIKLSKKQTSFITGLVILLISSVYQIFQPKPQTLITQSKVLPTLIATQSAELVKVTKVIDGDTIKLENGQTVRYIGIDTPETKHPQKKLQCFGKEAFRKNKELVEGKFVRLEKDISETDKYWRLLRYVYLPTDATPSGVFINDYLVREGFAHAATFPPDVRYAEYFRNLEIDAQKNNKGLWKTCPI